MTDGKRERLIDQLIDVACVAEEHIADVREELTEGRYNSLGLGEAIDAAQVFIAAVKDLTKASGAEVVEGEVS